MIHGPLVGDLRPLLRMHRWGNNGGRKWKGNRTPTASINFITAHDGFTLADLVAYNEKVCVESVGSVDRRVCGMA